MAVEHQHAGGNTRAVKKVVSKANNGFHQIILQQPLPYGALCTAAKQNTVGQHHAHASVGVQAGNHVLHKGKIAIRFGRAAVFVAAVGVALGPDFMPPFFERKGRVGNNPVKGHKRLALAHQMLGVAQGIATQNIGVVNIVQKQVHLADGPCVQVHLLPEHAQRTRVAPLARNVVKGLQQHAARTAGGVVNAHVGFWLQNLHNKLYHLLGGVELAAFLARIVRKLGDQVFIAIAQHVWRNIAAAQAVLVKMLKQPFQRGIGESLFIVEIHVLKHAKQAGVGVFNGMKGHVEGLAYVCCFFAHIAPKTASRNMKTVLVRVGGHFVVGKFLHAQLVFFFPHVREALEKEQAKNIVLVIRAINLAAKNIGCAPKMAL